jgi:hypothetical protein
MIKSVDRCGREWEMFCDTYYYGMWCVRLTSDREFDSLRFHFDNRELAEQFLTLITMSR